MSTRLRPKMSRKRKTTIHGGFKAMEHKKERKTKVSHKRHPRRKRALTLATPAQPMPQGAPPQGAAPGGAPPQGGGAQTGQVLQLMQIIAKASDALGKVLPASSPMVSAIQDQLQQIQAKVAETQRPTQPQAPPI